MADEFSLSRIAKWNKRSKNDLRIEMSEKVNFCLKFVYEFISNHSQVKFIDSFLVSMV